MERDRRVFPDLGRADRAGVMASTLCFSPPGPRGFGGRAAIDASSRFSVPVTLVSTKSCRDWVATWGLCNAAA